MWRTLLSLVGMLCALNGLAVTNEELLKNLKSRIHALPEEKGSLIKSFTHHSQSFIYDQALAIIALTKENDQESARSLLKGLASVQMADGSFYFSYFMDGTSPYPGEGDKRISGAMAWVALSATHYQHKFKSKEFFPMNFKLLSYLKKEMVSVKINSKEIRTLRFAPNDVASTPFTESDIAALEHNLDAFAAFTHFSKINNLTLWNQEIADLKSFILSMWDKDRSHFWSGVALESGHINKSELYLDNQTWSLLALDRETLKEISPDNALTMNCDSFFVQHEGINGFMDSRPTRSPASHEFVWSEGTLGQVLAMRKLRKMKNETVYCKEMTSTDILTSVKKMKKEDGGIAYATNTTKQDFTNASSVAGTAWLYFAANDFNPFHVEGLN